MRGFACFRPKSQPDDDTKSPPLTNPAPKIRSATHASKIPQGCDSKHSDYKPPVHLQRTPTTPIQQRNKDIITKIIRGFVSIKSVQWTYLSGMRASHVPQGSRSEVDGVHDVRGERPQLARLEFEGMGGLQVKVAFVGVQPSQAGQKAPKLEGQREERRLL